VSWPRVALFSLSESSGAATFARALAARGTKILATSGTARRLADEGVTAAAVEDWTGMPELLGGRVKTLHPHVHAPILARREVADDLASLEQRGLEPIDLVVVTLYPFEARAAALPDGGFVEEIDIGGVALLRAAAKNHADVIVAHDPAQYPAVLEALEAGGPTHAERRALARAAFARTSRYDAAIAADLARRAGDDPPPAHMLALERVRGLRYGENPHQAGALYAGAGRAESLEAWQEGKELSYNNLLDLHAAVSLVWRFTEPACVIVKHGEPCGVAVATTVASAYEQALASDSRSAYGGIVAFNRPLDAETTEPLAGQFVECVAAPSLGAGVEERLRSKRNLRVVRLAAADVASPEPWQLRAVGPWWLAQRDRGEPAPPWRTVTRRAATAEETRALRFAWEVAAAARSNAVAVARDGQLLGLGSGQTSRVTAVEIALLKAREAGHDPRGAVLASDGFFPFSDNIDVAAGAGITALVQPGGSVRDAEVVAACDRHGVAMLFTDRREFRH